MLTSGIDRQSVFCFILTEAANIIVRNIKINSLNIRLFARCVIKDNVPLPFSYPSRCHKSNTGIERNFLQSTKKTGRLGLPFPRKVCSTILSSTKVGGIIEFDIDDLLNQLGSFF